MKPRIGLDLEPGFALARTLPSLDLLDVAYGAVHGGAQMIQLPLSALVSSRDSAESYHRVGIPFLTVRVDPQNLDRVAALGSIPDRIVMMDDHHLRVTDPVGAAETAHRMWGAAHEIGILVDADAANVKELSRAKIPWIYFSTEQAYQANSMEEAQAEIAKLTSAVLTANKMGMRVALYGEMGLRLPSTFSAIPHVEELYPTPDLWSMALRSGWEAALAEFCNRLG